MLQPNNCFVRSLCQKIASVLEIPPKLLFWSTTVARRPDNVSQNSAKSWAIRMLLLTRADPANVFRYGTNWKKGPKMAIWTGQEMCPEVGLFNW